MKHAFDSEWPRRAHSRDGFLVKFEFPGQTCRCTRAWLGLCRHGWRGGGCQVWCWGQVLPGLGPRLAVCRRAGRLVRFPWPRERAAGNRVGLSPSRLSPVSPAASPQHCGPVRPPRRGLCPRPYLLGDHSWEPGCHSLGRPHPVSQRVDGTLTHRDLGDERLTT